MALKRSEPLAGSHLPDDLDAFGVSKEDAQTEGVERPDCLVLDVLAVAGKYTRSCGFQRVIVRVAEEEADAPTVIRFRKDHLRVGEVVKLTDGKGPRKNYLSTSGGRERCGAALTDVGEDRVVPSQALTAQLVV